MHIFRVTTVVTRHTELPERQTARRFPCEPFAGPGGFNRRDRQLEDNGVVGLLVRADQPAEPSESNVVRLHRRCPRRMLDEDVDYGDVPGSLRAFTRPHSAAPCPRHLGDLEI